MILIQKVCNFLGPCPANEVRTNLLFTMSNRTGNALESNVANLVGE